jgi:hypothetical protein
MSRTGPTPGLLLLLIAAVILLANAAGCSGNRIPKTHPVAGKVVHKGGKPVTFGRVEFQSKTHPDLKAVGNIQTDGTFTLTTHLEGKNTQGAVEGEHTVLIELESRSSLVVLPAPYTVNPGENTCSFEVP